MRSQTRTNVRPAQSISSKGGMDGTDDERGRRQLSIFQFISAAYGVGSTDSVLNNLLLESLPRYLPSQNPFEALHLGASSLESSFNGDELRGDRRDYLDGLHGSWALAIALFDVAFLAALMSKAGDRLEARQHHRDSESQENIGNLSIVEPSDGN
ncbi:hypothetical protein F5X96DRAFT_675621 [Biscogniauxia mediterranea]|nr:hypothetical protein F5X96DRAFT_675621 [Biscogniauxia mediterranea]